MAFDPLQLTREASLNRTVLADLSGADRRLVDRRGWEVLRLEVLESLAAEYGLHAVERTDVPRRLRAALDSSDLGQVDPARRVVAEFGRRLGHLVATLRLGDEQASPWRTAYRQHWRAVDRIWVGGGIVAALGHDLVRSARAEAARLGVNGTTLDLAAHADLLALIGAARTRTTPAARSIVLDFGYSSVKRGIAGFRGDVLYRLEVLRSVGLPRPGLDGQSTPDEVMHAVVGVIGATFNEAHEYQLADIDRDVGVSLATYLAGGRPAASAELYDRLGEVDFDTFSAEVGRVAGVPLAVRFVHDGTAAAAALQSNGREGIIVLGTSLGAGFTVPDQPRLPIAADLLVTRRE